MPARLLLMCRKLGTPPGYWVERARELFAGAFARTWPVDFTLPMAGSEQAEAPPPVAMRKKS